MKTFLPVCGLTVFFRDVTETRAAEDIWPARKSSVSRWKPVSPEKLLATVREVLDRGKGAEDAP